MIIIINKTQNDQSERLLLYEIFYQVAEGGCSGVADDTDGDGTTSRDGETLQVAPLHAAVDRYHTHVTLITECDCGND